MSSLYTTTLIAEVAYDPDMLAIDHVRDAIVERLVHLAAANDMDIHTSFAERDVLRGRILDALRLGCTLEILADRNRRWGVIPTPTLRMVRYE